ncbi:glycosyltransferase [Microbulbifer sp. SSSA008]|uniref:glycosyltransferase n=1 Tax=Microbulbifer sp. SSSA008 TaxID=3243380 RepID=UPI00403A3C5F
MRKYLSESSKLRIGFFIPWITQGRGGTESVGALIANLLSRRGHNIFIYTYDSHHGKPTWHLDPEIKLRTFDEDINGVSCGQTIFELAADNLDVLVGFHMNREFIRYVYYGWKLNVPVILSEHINPEFPRKIGNFNKREREIIFSGANHIHVLLPEYRDTLPPYLREKTTVIPNTVRLPKKQANPDRGADNYILCVARLVKRKRVDLLIRGFAASGLQSKGWRLKIAGYGSEEANLKSLSSQLAVTKSVDFLGKVDVPYPLFEQANIFVLPSEAEGFALTCLEAMAHGLPLIGYADCLGLNYQIQDGESGILCSPEDPVDSLATALKQLGKDKSMRALMGQKGLSRFSELFSHEVIVEKWESMIASTVEEAGNSLRTLALTQEDLDRVRLMEVLGSNFLNYGKEFKLGQKK